MELPQEAVGALATLGCSVFLLVCRSLLKAKSDLNSLFIKQRYLEFEFKELKKEFKDGRRKHSGSGKG